MHLDIAAVEILSFKPDDYFRTQQSWKQEVWEHNERMKGEDSNLPLADHNALLKRRKEELRHAQDIKELYERKLEKVRKSKAKSLKNDFIIEITIFFPR